MVERPSIRPLLPFVTLLAATWLVAVAMLAVELL
jgi:hypothetical protein